MIEFGNTLRAARESKGLTVRQLAELTRMTPTTIHELETENFSRIVAPIYGRGFVKLYCEAVGLDAKPLVDEFMDIFNGNHQPEIRERACSSTPAEPASDPVPAATPDPVSDPPETPVTSDLFNEPPPMEALPKNPHLARYAAPLREERPSVDLRAYLRLGILALVALAFLLLLFCGLKAVYRATTHTTAETETESAAATVETDTTPKKARTPQKIPSFYMN